MRTSPARCASDIVRCRLLFVYGTLRKEGGANEILEGCCFKGTARLPKHSLAVGGIPFCFPDPESTGRGVVGEVYELPDPAKLQRLDQYEGYSYYRPLVRPVMDEGSREVEAWIYMANIDLARDLRADIRRGRLDRVEDFVTHDGKFGLDSDRW